MGQVILDGINRLKDKLLDLTKRNKLIKYTERKAYNLVIIDDSLEYLYDQLVAKEDELSFLALPLPKDDEDKALNEQEWAMKLGFSLDVTFKKPQNTKAKKKQIQTLHFVDKMNSILLKIFRDSKTFEQETGRNMLFLCLGFLKWKEIQYSDEYLLSPLICIPIEIKRNKIASTTTFSICCINQNDVDINQALKEKLKADFDIQMPDFKGYDCLGYLQKLSRIIEDREGWEVKSQVAIDFLRFEKILMYQDLKDWKGKTPLEEIEVFKDIFQGKEFEGEYFSQEYEIDNLSLNELRDYPLVVDADSSQHSAIIDAINGKNIIIEGPPGSGKSQTITNIIALLLTRKKTVLFVSEKSAALDVVYRRLKQVGLGDFCLELHSHKTRPRHILKSISDRIEKRIELDHEIMERYISQINDRKKEIREYLDVLHQKYGKIKKKIFNIIWIVEKYQSAKKILEFDIEDADDWDYDKLLKTQKIIREYENLYQELKQSSIELDFWKGLDIQNFSEIKKDKIVKSVFLIKDNLVNICELLASLNLKNELSEAKNIKNFFKLEFQNKNDEYSNMVTLFQKLSQKIKKLEAEINVPDLKIGEYFRILEVIEHIRKISYHQYKNIYPQMLDYDIDMQIIRFEEIQKNFFQCKEEVLEFTLTIDDVEQKSFDEWCNIEKTVQKYKDSLFAFCFKDYRHAKVMLKEVLQEKLPKDKNKWVAFIKKIKKYFEVRDKIIQDKDFVLAFGGFYKGLDTNTQEVKTIFYWLEDFKKKFSHEEINDFLLTKISSQVIKGLGGAIEDIKNLDNLIKNARGEQKWDNRFKDDLFEMHILEVQKFLLNIWQIIHSRISEDTKKNILANFDYIAPLCKVRDEIDEVTKQMKKNGLDFYKFFDSCHLFSQCVQKIEQVEKAKEILSKWVVFQKISLELSSLGISKLIDRVSMQKTEIKIEEVFLYNFYHSLLKKAFLEFPILERCDRTILESTIKDFKQLDKELLGLNQKRIACGAMFYPDVDYGLHLGGSSKDRRERGLIEAEIKKQKKNISLRDLVRRAPKSLQSLKPIFMMSPLSVAQYLDPEAIDFDVLIIDEASQLRPEEALGAIARSKQVIIVGDPKQLPPTNFFTNKNEDEDEEEDGNVASENESILDACLGVYRPIRQLRWHYRSRHEDLIRFSNSKFYDGNLIVFPSSKNSKIDPLGIGYHYIEEARYLKKTNKVEAEKIVKYFLELIERYPEKSIGVATFNKSQCDLIQDMVDTQGLKSNYLSSYLERWEERGEPFFVKNLENIQGDERDIILISTTYGRDSETNKLYMRFGPINSHYGWRRLNVIFTRSRERMEIFTSMKSSEIVVSENAQRGVRDLKMFLEYVERGVLEGLSVETEREFDSDFEISVFNVLSEYGFEIEPQVGVSGYFIDLAIKSKSENKGYILAVECDGATYHSSKSARDRDRLRQEVLENLGWKFHRIWSVDWYKNRDIEIQKLIKRIHDAQVEFDQSF